MTKDEALKLALEALEGVLDDAPKVLDASIAGGLYEVVQCRDAITAIKEALANDALERKAENARELGLDYEPEPVAWAHHSTFENLNSFERSRYSATLAKKQTDACCIPLYTTQPQRTWVGLTDEEVDQFHNWKDCTWSTNELVRYVEQTLKDKNT